MTVVDGSYGLRGRSTEVARLERLLGDVRAGQGQALLVRGEAGIGKSALLNHLIGRADGCRVARAAGVESEMELPFAGLHQLCGPMLDLAGRLSPVQREALEVALGQRAGGPPDRFLVGAATLTLLTEASVARPLLCVVDDGQWLDQASAQALTFAGRRLFADRVGVVFGLRDPVTLPQWQGLPELVVGGLADDAAKSLLDAVIPGRIDAHVEARIVAETRGNPLALMELPRGLTAAELAGGFARPDVRPLASQLEQNFARRVRALSPQTQCLLLTAAAEPIGDVPLLLRALAILDVPLSAAEAAEAAGLIEFGAKVRFRHPLVRSATYRAATAADRRTVHRALAEATDPAVDPDRRAWHRAHGAAGPSEDIAEELVRSAERAQGRGGVAAGAAFLQQATELTPAADQRAIRALAAARATLEAGDFATALRLLLTAGEGPPDALKEAHIDLVQAQVALFSGRTAEAASLLVAAAHRFEPLDADLARDTYLNAMSAALLAGRLAGDTGLVEVSRAARTLPRPDLGRKRDLVLEGSVAFYTDGFPAAVTRAVDAIRAFVHTQGPPDPEDVRWLGHAGVLTVHLWDSENWDVLTRRNLQIARDLGQLTELPWVLHHRVYLSLFAGEITAAEALSAESRTIMDATGAAMAPYGEICVAAWRGRSEDTSALITSCAEDSEARGEGLGVTLANFANAVLLNSLTRYGEALAPARAATAYPPELGIASWALPELVEAAARSDRPDLAADALDRLSVIAQASGTDWALGALARSKALTVTDPSAAETAYQEAVRRLGRTGLRMELARAHLLYGEWLRQKGRRQDARRQLRTAYELFTTFGADAFADRAAHELAATGEAMEQRTATARDILTGQEAHIAELARTGLTNVEIGAQLFLSRHTVDWHLRKIFTKLGITSRRQLQAVLTESAVGDGYTR
ncbi:helix-turn-helix transcriptional regulator [Kribbella sp. CA-247076]|uniref:helix-turn-helix transcriptional regulator n=1 Tax=Kribbella sp. CA-247076 TaxID=3239941 RepID=UPI003D8C3153